MPLGMEVGLSPTDFVLDGDPSPFPKKETEPGGGVPNFRPMSIVAKRTAGWIKMALGMEVGLGLVHIVLDGDTAPLVHIVLDGDTAPLPKKGAEPPPNFRPIFIVAKRLDAARCHLVYGGRPQPRRLC